MRLGSLMNTIQVSHLVPIRSSLSAMKLARMRLRRLSSDRAKIQRLLQVPRAIHRKNIPPPPTRHDQLADHSFGHLFEQAEETHLQSHKEMRSWTEILRCDVPGRPQILDCMWIY